jgi:hypothetical protein
MTHNPAYIKMFIILIMVFILINYLLFGLGFSLDLAHGVHIL